MSSWDGIYMAVWSHWAFSVHCIVTNALSRGPEYQDNYLLISWLLPGARLKIIIFLWVHYLQTSFSITAQCTAVRSRARPAGKRKGWQIVERRERRDFSHFLSWYQGAILPASSIRCHSGLTDQWLVIIRTIRAVLTALWSSSLLSSNHYHYHQYHCPHCTSFLINN